ncbi:MAG: hypothetical protein HZB51_03290 [Chloroflexi bacterium]|nr:hypothetical protein [Chloroflexota bacterium]
MKRPIDWVRLFAKLYPQVELPASFFAFLDEQELVGHQIRRADTKQPLVLFLKELGIPLSSFSKFLDADSRVKLKLSFPTLLHRPAHEIETYFVQNFSTVFALQQIVLDSVASTGFNRHDKQHVRTVTRRVIELLEWSQIPTKHNRGLKAEALIAGYLHDIGNLIGRKEHGLYSIYLLTQLFADLDRDKETQASFIRVLEATLFHEVDLGSRFPSLTDLHPATLGLIIADKSDVSFRRVSAKSNVSDAIKDAHTLVNLLTADSQIKCQKKNFQWEIHFSPKVQLDETDQFLALLKRAERVWVPDEWQQLYRRANIEYVFIFHATFLRLYFSRLAFAIRSVFALNPAVETFRLMINDDERGVSLSRVFSRDDYEAKIALIGNNLFKNVETESRVLSKSNIGE